MRWMWSWWRRHRRDEAAVAARQEAERKLREVERMGDQVQKVADHLVAHLEQNNFAALVAAAFRGRR